MQGKKRTQSIKSYIYLFINIYSVDGNQVWLDSDPFYVFASVWFVSVFFLLLNMQTVNSRKWIHSVEIDSGQSHIQSDYDFIWLAFYRHVN